MSLRFAPRWPWVLLTALAIAAFTWLGFWQYDRGTARAQQWQAFEGAGEAREAGADELAALPRWARVQVRGQWDEQRQFLLDNISHAGAPGYEVLSVLRMAQGGELLVNRGWVPFSGYRDRLPDVAFPQGSIGAGNDVVLTGRLGALPVAGLAAGRQTPATEGPWPRLTSFPEHAELEASLGSTLLPPVLLLDPDSDAGYLREWSPPGLAPERHFGYALQWWMFAIAAFVLFLVLNLKRAR